MVQLVGLEVPRVMALGIGLADRAIEVVDQVLDLAPLGLLTTGRDGFLPSSVPSEGVAALAVSSISPASNFSNSASNAPRGPQQLDNIKRASKWV